MLDMVIRTRRDEGIAIEWGFNCMGLDPVQTGLMPTTGSFSVIFLWA